MGWLVGARRFPSIVNGPSDADSVAWRRDFTRTYLERDVAKRLVKSNKVYIRNSGLLRSLLGITDMDSLLSHPAVTVMICWPKCAWRRRSS